ncbi:hypothetical protein [Desulforamulus reducens]|uniref:hypothetical protein n=1 Tax=Desulforamulus reducens TaxID=59610 RepID=UPI00059DF6D9|nr:hypothetical protein [Desulforamulus reducens]
MRLISTLIFCSLLLGLCSQVYGNEVSNKACTDNAMEMARKHAVNPVLIVINGKIPNPSDFAEFAPLKLPCMSPSEAACLALEPVGGIKNEK